MKKEHPIVTIIKILFVFLFVLCLIDIFFFDGLYSYVPEAYGWVQVGKNYTEQNPQKEIFITKVIRALWELQGIHNKHDNTLKLSETNYFGLAWANIDTTNLCWSIPDSGTYLLYATLRVIHDGDAQAGAEVRLYNNTTSAEITNSERTLIEMSNASIGYCNFGTTLIWMLDFTEASTVYLQGLALFNADTAGVVSNSTAYHEIGYVKIAK